MNPRHLLRTAAIAGAVMPVCMVTTLAYASVGTNIDHVEVSETGIVTMVLAADGLPSGVRPDLDSLRVQVDGKQVEATVRPIETGDVERTTVLALDASNSMAGTRFNAAKAAAKAFLESAPDDVNVGLLTFSSEIHVLAKPTTNHEAVANEIDQLELTYGTHVYDAVLDAVDLTGEQGARSVVLLSDGEDQGKGSSLAKAVESAKSARVVVDVVALEQEPENLALISQIADTSGGSIIDADEPAELEAAFRAQAEALASQLLVTFTPPPGVAQEANISVSLSAGGKTYHDAAFVTLAAADAPAGPAAVHVKAPLINEVGLWAGGLALAVGLAGLLAVILLGGPGPASLAQRQLAHYSARQQVKPDRSVASSSSSLRESAVAMTEKVVKGDFETRLAQRLNGAGLALTAAEWLLLHAGIVAGSAFVGFALGDVPLMLLLLGCGIAIPWLFLRFKHSRRLGAFNAQLAETLQLLAGGLSAGLSLPQAIDTVVREGHDPMAGEMRRALVEQRLGVEIEETLDGLADRMASKDFAWVVMAIRIQREVGGNLAELLNTVADTLREREYLRRQVKVLSAEGRFSAWVLGGLPVAMFIFLLLARPEVIGPMFTDPMGLLMLLAAVVLLIGGFFTMSKLVKVEV